MGDDERAVAVYESIIATHPRTSMRWSAWVMRSSGRGASARRAMSLLAPSRRCWHPSLLAAQGRLHHASGHPEPALGYYERALAIDSASTTLRANTTSSA